MKIFILSIALTLVQDLIQMGGHPQVVEETGAYTLVQLTDSTRMEVFQGDSITVILTACAPQCSSCARVYNKEWQLIATPKSPTPSIFPLATMDKKTGAIIWTDNDDWEY